MQFRARCLAAGLTPNGFKIRSAQAAFVREQKDRIIAAGYDRLETPTSHSPVRFHDKQGRKRIMLLPHSLSIEQIADYCEDHPAPKYARQDFVIHIEYIRHWWAERMTK